MRQNGVRSNVRFPTGASGMKKGGSAKKKKQGYKDRKDESIAMRIRKKRTKKQLRASADDSYGKFGSKAKKSGKNIKGKDYDHTKKKFVSVKANRGGHGKGTRKNNCK